MPNGHDIICIGLISWQHDYTKSTMQLLTELAVDNRVLYVNYAYSVKDVWQHLRGQKRIPLRQVLGRTDRISRHRLANGHEVFVLIPPPILPINQLRPGRLYSALLRWNTRLIRRSVRRAMQRLTITAPIVINALHPVMGNQLAGTLDEKALVYYCYDAIEAESWSRWHGPPAEAQLLQRVDAVVTTSTGLFAVKKRAQSRCYLVENGVDVGLFEQANVPRTHRIDKTVGYIGSIDNRLDVDLLERCFRTFPDVRFLLVGRVPEPALAERLRRFANVVLAGAQPPADLPGFVRQMDVGLIPFSRNEQTRAIYPLKINEYLAAGLPVVSTDFTDLRAFDPVVAVCTDADAFVGAIAVGLCETDPALPQQRLALARTNSWAHRGRQFADVLDQVLRAPAAPVPSTAVPDYTV